MSVIALVVIIIAIVGCSSRSSSDWNDRFRIIIIIDIIFVCWREDSIIISTVGIGGEDYIIGIGRSSKNSHSFFSKTNTISCRGS